MEFFVYENWTAEDKAIVHESECSFCKHGKGIHENIRGEKNGRWHGPFITRGEAISHARSLGRRLVKACAFCS